MTNLIEKAQALGFNLEINYELLIAKATRINSKSRFPKPEFHYRFRTQEGMTEVVEQWIRNKEERIKEKQEKKQKIAELKQNMQHGFNDGDIVYDSWGYEQTNIDFYQVLKADKKSLTLTKIGSSYAKNQPTGNSPMSAHVVPDPSHKIGKPFKKIIQVSICNNVPNFRISSKYGSFSKYIAGSQGIYESWYA